jgi:hypothetical protein
MAAIGNIDWTSPNQNYRSSATAATSGGANGTDKLWLPIWSGEVIRAYDHYRIFEPMVESRSIASGRAMEFPITGTVAMKSAWNAGEELVGNVDDHVSKTIAVTLDARPIAAHFEIDNIDLMISQWEFRSELARQAGQTLSNARDLQVGAYLVRAALEDQIATDPRLSGVGTVSKWRNTLKASPVFHAGAANTDGTVVSKSALANLGLSSATPAQRASAALALLECIEEFMVHLQEINAPTAGVYCAVSPRVFQDIRALGVARTSADLAGGAGRPYFGGVAEAGGLGAGLSDGMAALTDSLEYMGCRIVKTNHMPDFNASAATDLIGEDRYNLNFAAIGVGAVIWQSGAVASIQKTGLKVDTVDDVRRNTVFTVASIMAGTGVLKPECASIVCTAAVTDGADGGSTVDKADFREDIGMTGTKAPEFTNLAGGSGYYA